VLLWDSSVLKIFSGALFKFSFEEGRVNGWFLEACTSVTSSTVISFGFGSILSEGSVRIALSFIFFGCLVAFGLIGSGTSIVILLNLYYF